MRECSITSAESEDTLAGRGTTQIIFNMLRHKPATSAFLAKVPPPAIDIGRIIALRHRARPVQAIFSK